MTKEQEAQQAQTIAEIKERARKEITTPNAPGYLALSQCGRDRKSLIAIVELLEGRISELNKYIAQREAGCADCHDIKGHNL